MPKKSSGKSQVYFQIPFGEQTGTVAAASTVYLPTWRTYGQAAGDSASEVVISFYLITRAGTLKNLVCKPEAAPGAGETYVYTIRKNSVDTSLTATVSDAETKATDETNTVTVAVGDLISCKLVTSAGAAAKKHGVAIQFEG